MPDSDLDSDPQAAMASEPEPRSSRQDDGAKNAAGRAESLEPGETTQKRPPPDRPGDVHDVTTAAPEQRPEQNVDDEQAKTQDGKDGMNAAGDSQDETNDPSRHIRVPPPHDPPREVQRWRMRALTNTPLILLGDDEEPASLSNPDGVLGEAELCLAQGNVEQASALVTDLLPAEGEALDARGASALGIVIRGALMGGDVDRAAELLEPHRDHADLAVADAAYSLALGQLDRARTRIEAAMKQKAGGLAEVYTLALVRVAEGDMDLARELLTDVARSAPDHAVARHQLGQLILASGDPARAGTLFEMAIQLAPDFVPPSMSLAEMLAESRQYGEAMQLLSQLCDDHPGLLAPRLLQLRILLSVGDLETAGSLADALREAAPNVADIEILWAETAVQRGRAAEARETLQALVPAGGGIAEKALRLLAQIELGTPSPDPTAAIGYLDQALELMPGSAELLIEKAQAHLIAGDMTAARESFEKLGDLPHVDLGHLLNAAVAAQNHGLFRTAVDLAELALDQVRDTPAEAQISSFIAQLQGV